MKKFLQGTRLNPRPKPPRPASKQTLKEHEDECAKTLKRPTFISKADELRQTIGGSGFYAPT
jgi:hypothetical protein